MRLEQYLKENKEIPFDEIFKDCKPFLKELKKSNYEFLYSGRKNRELVIHGKVRKNREPRHTPEIVHNIINNKFKDKFGVKARSESLFAIKNRHLSELYGEPFYVFPKGRYNLIYNEKIEDLYEELFDNIDSTYGIKNSSNLFDKFENNNKLVWNENSQTFEIPPKNFQNTGIYLTKKEFMNDVENIIKDLLYNYKETTKLNKISSTQEIMIITNEVWMIHTSAIFEEDLKKMINDMI